MSRTLFSTSVKSPKSFASASAASTAFWAACSNKTKNSLFLGRSDRRTGVLLWRHMLPYPGRRRRWPALARVGHRGERQQSVTTVVTVGGALRRRARLPALTNQAFPATPDPTSNTIRSIAPRRQGSKRRGMRFAQALARQSPCGERKRKHDVALRDRDHGRHRARDDHRGLPRYRRVRPWLQRSPRAPQGVAHRARRTHRRWHAGAGVRSQGELAPSKSGRKGPPKGGPFVCLGPLLGPEELLFQVVDGSLERVDDSRDARRDDLHTPVAGDPQLIAWAHRG